MAVPRVNTPLSQVYDYFGKHPEAKALLSPIFHTVLHTEKKALEFTLTIQKIKTYAVAIFVIIALTAAVSVATLLAPTYLPLAFIGTAFTTDWFVRIYMKNVKATQEGLDKQIADFEQWMKKAGELETECQDKPEIFKDHIITFLGEEAFTEALASFEKKYGDLALKMFILPLARLEILKEQRDTLHSELYERRRTTLNQIKTEEITALSSEEKKARITKLLEAEIEGELLQDKQLAKSLPFMIAYLEQFPSKVDKKKLEQLKKVLIKKDVNDLKKMQKKFFFNFELPKKPSSSYDLAIEILARMMLVFPTFSIEDQFSHFSIFHFDPNASIQARNEGATSLSTIAKHLYFPKKEELLTLSCEIAEIVTQMMHPSMQSSIFDSRLQRLDYLAALEAYERGKLDSRPYAKVGKHTYSESTIIETDLIEFCREVALEAFNNYISSITVVQARVRGYLERKRLRQLKAAAQV